MQVRVSQCWLGRVRAAVNGGPNVPEIIGQVKEEHNRNRKKLKIRQFGSVRELIR